MVTLRPYQQAAVEAVWAAIRADEQASPCVVLPTGSGKTWLACALGHRAARCGFTVSYARAPRLLEELRVSLFAQELRTPMPVSVKRLQKAWDAYRNL